MVLFLGVVVLSAIGLYKSGRLVTDKMQLQNAADAVAYSVTVVEARDLNFAAYMNRSMVANEVAIGQMVGVASWAGHTRSFGSYLRSYDLVIAQPLASNPFTGAVGAPISSALKGTATVFERVGDVLNKTFKPLAQAFAIISHGANYAFGAAQTIFHYASVAGALGVVDEMIERNGPDGARLSNYGILSMVSHMATFTELPGFPGTQYTKAYNPTTICSKDAAARDDPVCDHAGAYERLAAVVQDSRDNFSKNRGWELQFFRVLNQMGLIPDFLVFDLNDAAGNRRTYLGLNIEERISLGPFRVEFALRFGFYFDMARDGGSELRQIGQDNESTAGRFYNWSAADGTNMGIGVTGRIAAGLFVNIPFIGWTFIAGIPDCSASAINDQLDFSCNLGPISIGIPPIFFPTTAPLATGFAQAASGSNELNSSNDLMGTQNPFGADGPISIDAYGRTPLRSNAWYGLPFSTVPPFSLENSGGASSIINMASWKSRKVAPYSGLAPYVDTTDEIALNFSGGPFIVMGLELGETDFERNSWSDPSQRPAGRFNVDDELAAEKLAVIAKSELYFKRPNDLSYFRRGDDYEEHGSTFNPYWQARLAETSHADRVVALAIQQNEGTVPPFAVAEFNEFIDNLEKSADAARAVLP